MGRVIQPTPSRTRLGRHDDTAGVRRPRTFGAGTLRRGGGTPGRRGSGRGALDLRPAGRPEPAALRHRGAEAALPAGHRPGRLLLRHRHVRTGRGLDLAAVRTRGRGWTAAGGVRHQDLDQRRAPGARPHRAAAHRAARRPAASRRPQPAAHRTRPAGRDHPADHLDDRRASLQRGRVRRACSCPTRRWWAPSATAGRR